MTVNPINFTNVKRDACGRFEPTSIESQMARHPIIAEHRKAELELLDRILAEVRLPLL